MDKHVTCRTIDEQASSADGRRVLVDRDWPAAVPQRQARLDDWLREVAPSGELHRWYSADVSRFAEFRRRYLAELGDPGHHEAADRLRELAAGHDRLTLLTAARDVDRSHAAVLAEWLTAAGRPEPEPLRSSPRAAVSSALADLNAGALAFVMGTGIVSTALSSIGAHTASAVLLVVALAGFAVLIPAYGWRLLHHRERFVTDFLGPRSFAFLTVAISSNVLAARLVLDGHTAAAGAFLAFGTLAWLLLDYGIPLALITSVRRGPSIDQVNGTWFLWAVGSESVALAAASLGRTTTGHLLPVLAGVGWAIGLVQYLLTAAVVLARLLVRPVQAKGLMTSVWIFMGAAALCVLAGVRLLELPPSGTLPARPVVLGASVVLWSFSTWLIPLLLALGVWRHAVRRIPLRYELGWWNLVFPIGMYAAATYALGRATHTSWLATMGRWEVWVAGGVWVVAFIAMLATALRSRLVAGHGGRPDPDGGARADLTSTSPGA
ncbi:DUF488 family protein [Streptomyces sp. NPDC086783]|uniref:SLAC1 family transporter n=1 Tax=Streptomyces sp. NPDC086783 TaxID=3365758 RepID=UPI0037FD07E5